MSVGQIILATIHRSMMERAVFHDTPMTPWRDPITQACIDRICAGHVSCIRREAWCTFEAWYERVRLADAALSRMA